MIKAKGIDHINLEVPNLAAAKEFYQNIFGLQVKEDYEYSAKDGSQVHFMLIGISETLMLCLYENKEVNLSEMPLNHIGFNVENFDEAFKIATEKGILDDRWGMIDYKHSRSFYVKDPNGLGIEISEHFGGGH